MKTAPKAPLEIPIKSYRSSKEWLTWPEKNHAKSSGLCLKIAKSATEVKSVSYEALRDGSLARKHPS